jgi:hypothetical protein
MKTLKPGKIDAPVPAQKWVGEIVVCTRCGGHFQLEASDPVTTLAESDQAPRHGEIICPTQGCRHIIWIPL